MEICVCLPSKIKVGALVFHVLLWVAGSFACFDHLLLLFDLIDIIASVWARGGSVFVFGAPTPSRSAHLGYLLGCLFFSAIIFVVVVGLMDEDGLG